MDVHHVAVQLLADHQYGGFCGTRTRREHVGMQHRIGLDFSCRLAVLVR